MFSRPLYIVPRRYGKLFNKGEVIHKISFALQTGRWVAQQLLPVLDMPKRLHGEIISTFGNSETLLMRYFKACQRLPITIDTKKKFIFRSTWQERREGMEDPYLHELIAIEEDGSFLSQRTFHWWWEHFKLPIIHEPDYNDMQAICEEFCFNYGNDHPGYVIDRNRLILYPSMAHFYADWVKGSVSLGMKLYSTESKICDNKLEETSLTIAV